MKIVQTTTSIIWSIMFILIRYICTLQCEKQITWQTVLKIYALSSEQWELLERFYCCKGKYRWHYKLDSKFMHCPENDFVDTYSNHIYFTLWNTDQRTNCIIKFKPCAQNNGDYLNNFIRTVHMYFIMWKTDDMINFIQNLCAVLRIVLQTVPERFCSY